MVETPAAVAELEAMGAVNNALSGLQPESKARVLEWAASVHGVLLAKAAMKTTTVGTSAPDAEPEASAIPEDLASLYNRANPGTEPEKVLVCSYWHQFVQQRPEVTAQEVNTELKNLGHGVTNVTVAYNRLKDQRPALVMQVRKDGTTKQARKKYRVTVEGKRTVEAMLGREVSG